MSRKEMIVDEEMWYEKRRAIVRLQQENDRLKAIIEQQNKQAEPVAQPYAHIYEFDSVVLGTHRSFNPKEWNGMKPSRSVTVYTHPAPAVAQEPDLLDLKLPIAVRVGGGIFGKGVSLRTVANQLKRIQETYDDDLKDRMSKQSIYRENDNEAPAVAPADVVRELVGALDIAVCQNSHDMVMTGEELRRCEAALKSAKEHGL